MPNKIYFRRFIFSIRAYVMEKYPNILMCRRVSDTKCPEEGASHIFTVKTPLIVNRSTHTQGSYNIPTYTVPPMTVW